VSDLEDAVKVIEEVADIKDPAEPPTGPIEPGFGECVVYYRDEDTANGEWIPLGPDGGIYEKTVKWDDTILADLSVIYDPDWEYTICKNATFPNSPAYGSDDCDP